MTLHLFPAGPLLLYFVAVAFLVYVDRELDAELEVA